MKREPVTVPHRRETWNLMDGAKHKKTWNLMNGAKHRETWNLMDGAEHTRRLRT